MLPRQKSHFSVCDVPYTLMDDASMTFGSASAAESPVVVLNRSSFRASNVGQCGFKSGAAGFWFGSHVRTKPSSAPVKDTTELTDRSPSQIGP